MAHRPSSMSRVFGVVVVSMAALGFETRGFQYPQGTSLLPLSSRRKCPSLSSMSASRPDDPFSRRDEQPPSSSSRNAGDAFPDRPKTDEFGSLDAPDLSPRYADHQHNSITSAMPWCESDAPLNDTEVPAARRLRWEREALVRRSFAQGDDLFELRAQVARLRRELVDARTAPAGADERRVRQLEDELLQLNGRDAEFVHAVSSELVERAQSAGHDELAKKHRTRVEEARSCIPQLNMHGLWVGKYDSGYELINVTYSGDTLIATKVTGDQNVPKGATTFTVDLAPQFSSQADGAFAPDLAPIELRAPAREHWGRRYLPRHAGRGQVASPGFENARWLEGQMILVGRFFAFAWVPLGHQVFFGRPSAELVLKMLKEAEAEELRKDHVAVMKDAAEGMWEETFWAETERSHDNYHLDEEHGCFE